MWFLLCYIVGMSVTFLVYWISPKYYRAYTSILQPPENISYKGTGFSEGILSKVRTNTELFFSILYSRRMKDDVIKKFDLSHVYHIDNMDDTREVLEEITEIKLTKNKVIEVGIIDRNPERVAKIANFYAKNLDNLIKELTITTAKKNRIFIGERLEKTTNLINKLENRLKEIQGKNQLVADKELSEITQTAGDLMSKLLSRQLELKKKEEILNENDSEIILLKKEVDDIKNMLSTLLNSQGELSGILRELKVQESVYSSLTTKLEETKINETRDTPIVQVLDEAIVPDRVYKPDIVFMIALISGIIGGIGFFIFFFDLLKYLGSI